jgi:hypothetical protein
MVQDEWFKLLTETSELMLSDESFVEGNDSALITDEQRAAKWLGKPGATEAELAQLEELLQQQLPPSYRSFLATSNGFGPISYFIYDLYAAAEVDWLATKDAFLVELWEKDPPPVEGPELADERYLTYDASQVAGIIRPGHMRQCLMISDWGDAGFLALNPAVQHEGEWEAWHFANWFPGAQRYRSFAELMRDSFQSQLELRQAEG